jgi:hypothetical protein
LPAVCLAQQPTTKVSPSTLQTSLLGSPICTREAEKLQLQLQPEEEEDSGVMRRRRKRADKAFIF